MEDNWEEPSKVCRDKGLNVATKVHPTVRSKEDSVVTWKEFIATSRDKEKVCHGNKSMLLGETLSRQRKFYRDIN